MSNDLQQQIQWESWLSTSSFLSALTLNAGLFGIQLLAFSFLRKRLKMFYEPRSFIPLDNERVEPLPENLFACFGAIWDSDPKIVHVHNGLDAYMFLRFLRMMVIILLPIWFVSWAVLLPINGASPNAGLSGLDRFTFGNIASTATNRYAAHIILTWLFTGYICYILNSELLHFISARQQHLVDPTFSASTQANVVLLTGIPTDELSVTVLTHVFSHVPGGVKKVWINRDLKDLPDVYDRRLTACDKLESAENALIQAAYKRLRKEKGESTAMTGDVEDNSGMRRIDRLVRQNKRPTHRLPLWFMPFSLPLIGEKVDTIDWARREIVTTNKILEDARRLIEAEDQVEDGNENLKASASPQYPPLSSAFILFNQQIGAHIVAQSLTHHKPFRMACKYAEVAPGGVLWTNLGLNSYQARARTLFGWVIMLALLVILGIPVAYINIVPNVTTLCAHNWLAWLCHIPNVALSSIQGVLPSVLFSVVMMPFPIVLRLLARFEGVPTQMGIEILLMDRLFLFRVVYGFFVVTLSSGLFGALPQILQNPESVPTILAENLPSASTFFLSHIVVQGLSHTASEFLTITTLLLYYVKLLVKRFILGSTPRSMYNIRHWSWHVNSWGSLWSWATLLVVITLGYSIISPIINGLACVMFMLFYVLYKYIFTWQISMQPLGDSGGLFFPHAVQHVFVGLYVQQLCLCALFFLAQNGETQQVGTVEGSVMVALIVFTAIFNYILNRSYGSLLHALPLTLADRSQGMPQGAVVGEYGGDGGDEGRRRQVSKEEAVIGATSDHACAPTPGAVWTSRIDGGDDDESDEEPEDFVHPALGTGQRVIWVVEDGIGMSSVEVREMREEGIRAAILKGAFLDGKGNVDVMVSVPEDEKDEV